MYASCFRKAAERSQSGPISLDILSLSYIYTELLVHGGMDLSQSPVIKTGTFNAA